MLALLESKMAAVTIAILMGTNLENEIYAL
jgi:hypothetical protein